MADDQEMTHAVVPKPKYTPGPWLVSSTVLVCDAEARVIANCTPFDVDVLAIPMQQVLFNARLIAAAPDLLAALQLMCAENSGCQTWELAMDAIDRATDRDGISALLRESPAATEAKS